MYQALYRKYRPSNFSDVCGQDHITSVLKSQLQNGRVSHAYMFCGSRGTGKTTCAKILAKAVNCEDLQNGEPCNRCSSCLAINEERVLDVVEMDAASNNGVDHIRRLCDEVQYLPSEVKKRVYIIDEVHMLSTSAFNALLKTIEEPPSHVLFILATTEMNDIPATIMSRCQRFDFKRILPSVICDRLLEIAKAESIPLEKDAAHVIARLSDGAMRDALSLLEGCQGRDQTITAELLHSILGLGNRGNVIALARAIAERDASLCLSLVQEIYDQMSDFKEVLSQLLAVYRDLLVLSCVPDSQKFVEAYENELPLLQEISKLHSSESILYQAQLLEDFYAVYDRIANEKKASVEILMIRLCSPMLNSSNEAILARLSDLERAGVVTRSSPAIESTTVSIEKPFSDGAVLRSDHVVLEEEQEDASANDTSFRELVLKNALQDQAFIKPWLPQISFSKSDATLRVLSTPFVKGILSASGASELILNAAKELHPEITSIVFEEKTIEPHRKDTGLEDL